MQLVLNNMWNNRNRTYTQATHCKECNVEFSEINPRATSNRMCVPCLKIYNRKKSGWKDKHYYDEFKLEVRGDYYEQLQREFEEAQTREEWLGLIRTRLDNILNILHDKDKQ